MQAFAHTALGLAALALLIGAALQDLRERLIDNRYSLLLLVLGLGLHVVTAATATQALAGIAFAVALAGAVFTVGFMMWRLGGIGGGDVKLLVATTFLVGLDGLGIVLVGMALVGGALAVLCLLLPLLATRLAATGLLPLSAVAGGARPTVPYGVAIAAGGAWALVPTLPYLFW